MKISELEKAAIFFSIIAIFREYGIEQCEDEIKKIKDYRKRRKFMYLYKQILHKEISIDDIKC